MMLCGQERETLAAYLDGEIPADQATAFEQHLRTCTQCAAEIATMVSMRRALRPARTRFTPSAEFRQKIQTQVAPKKRSFRIFGGWPMAVAALAILLVSLVWMRQSALRSDAFREVADLHISDLASEFQQNRPHDPTKNSASFFRDRFLRNRYMESKRADSAAAPTVPLDGLRCAATWKRWTAGFVRPPKSPSVVARMPTSVSHV